MNLKLDKDSPFITKISFHLLIEALEAMTFKVDESKSQYTKKLLNELEQFAWLKTGIEDISLIEKHQKEIQKLLEDLFPAVLTHSEINAVTIPFHNFTFNYTERFKKILNDAGTNFNISIRNLNEDRFYVMNCCMILNDFFKQHIDFNFPLFYDIPDNNGITKHYRIIYNVDFLEIIPTEKAVRLSQNDIDNLIENFENISLWKEKFPKGSWILKGFSLIKLYDATIESAASNLKTNLLKIDSKKDDIADDLESIFRSIFNITDLKIGLTIYDAEEQKFVRPIHQKATNSFILNGKHHVKSNKMLYNTFLNCIFKKFKVFSISNVNQFVTKKNNERFGNYLIMQNIQSCVIAPVVKDGELLGVFELSSEKPRELNTVNANKLDFILPYLVDTLNNYKQEITNKIEALIQKEYTSIHPSVYWKFRNIIKKYIQTGDESEGYSFKEIKFNDVYPLYGQVDIKGSSEHRNKTIKIDLKKQLNKLTELLENLKSQANSILFDQHIFELQSLIERLNGPLKADTEQKIQNYIKTKINPIIHSTEASDDIKHLIEQYYTKVDTRTGLFYNERKKFDKALNQINKKMAFVLDEKQKLAQQIFPHYYERFKTDGVEHNLYIGASIDPSKTFDKVYLNNLRLWQLQTFCEMVREHNKLKPTLPYDLEVTSLILVFSSPITIRFRIDEKRFDIDGAYNARYEVIKKRIDKASIAGTNERIIEKEKITIIYSSNQEKKEYMNYIRYLQSTNMLELNVEEFEVEELQGVSGLKGIRVKVVHHLE